MHYLSGPIAVQTTEPGDLLVVDILGTNIANKRAQPTHTYRSNIHNACTRIYLRYTLSHILTTPTDIGPLPNSEWGFTGILEKTNGGGFLTNHYPHATKAIWNFEGIYAVSRHIPGVRFAGLMHPGRCCACAGCRHKIHTSLLLLLIVFVLFV